MGNKNSHNLYAYLSLISFTISFIMGFVFDNSDLMAVLMVISFILSIIGIVKSSRLKKEVGKRKGIVISIIICISTIFLILGLMTIIFNNDIEFVGDKVEELAFQRVKNEMKKQLKNPNSLSLNNIIKSYMIINDNGKAEFYNSQEELKNRLEEIENNKEYTICYTIDYSAQNGFGGMNRDIARAQITIYNKENQINSNTPLINFE